MAQPSRLKLFSQSIPMISPIDATLASIPFLQIVIHSRQPTHFSASSRPLSVLLLKFNSSVHLRNSQIVALHGSAP
jgi:hypothetical protein